MHLVYYNAISFISRVIRDLGYVKVLPAYVPPPRSAPLLMNQSECSKIPIRKIEKTSYSNSYAQLISSPELGLSNGFTIGRGSTSNIEIRKPFLSHASGPQDQSRVCAVSVPTRHCRAEVSLCSPGASVIRSAERPHLDTRSTIHQTQDDGTPYERFRSLSV
jgi:hypothetical protein